MRKIDATRYLMYFSMLLFSACGSLWSQTIRISGVMEIVTHSPMPSNVVAKIGITKPVKRREFVCETSGCKWQIRTRDIDEPLASADTYKVASDGTNTYWLKTFSSNAYSNLLATNPQASFFTNEGTITAGTVPVPVLNAMYSESQVAPIWFAYASPCSLDSLTGNRIRPVWIVHEAIGNDASLDPTVKITRSEEAPRLPMQAAFFIRGVIPATEFSAAAKSPVPFNNGWRIAEYEAHNFTNVAGRSFPQEARLTTFGPATGAKTSNDLAARITWQIHATSFREVDNGAMSGSPPAVSGYLYVTEDARLSKTLKGPALQYVTTNDWLGENVLRFKQLRAHATRLEYRAASKTSRGVILKRIAWSTFIAANAGLLIWAVVRSKRLKGREQKQQEQQH